jgi:hypothetical protein
MGFIELSPPVTFDGDEDHIMSSITTFRDLPDGRVSAHADMSVKFFPRMLGGSYAQRLSVNEVSSILTQAKELGVRTTISKKIRP